MFDQPEEKANKDHSRMIMAASSLLLIIVVLLTIIVGTRASKQPVSLEMARPGSAEFDAYAPFVKMSEIKKATAKSMLGGNIGMLSTHIRNIGDRALTGLQLRAVALGFSNEPLKERTITPIPKTRESLGPNETMLIEVQLERIPSPRDITEMTIEIVGFKVK